MNVRVAALVPLAALFGACGSSISRSDPALPLSPSDGSGAEQVFTAVFSDPNGADHLESAKVLINEYVDGRGACFVLYIRQENSFFLVNDSGEGSTRMKAGNGGDLSNSQCRLAGAGSSATVAGNRLKLVLDLHFMRGFTGKKRLFLASRNVAGKETALQPAGNWYVRVGCAQGNWFPSAEWTAPGSGGGKSGTFTFTYSAPAGPASLDDIRVLFNRTSDGASACYVAYDRTTGSIKLADDDGSKFASIPLKSNQTVGNSQCFVAAAGSSLSENATALTWKIAITFKPAFAGKKNVYLYALGCNQAESGMRKKGAWAVPYGSP